MSKFKHDYIEFENGEIKRMVCMSCGVTMAERAEVPSQKYPDKLVIRLQRFPNYGTRRIDLNNGTFTDLPICTDCKNIDPRDFADDVISQLQRGWQAELAAHGRDQRAFDDLAARNVGLKLKKRGGKHAG